MKTSIIYLGIALVTFTNVALAMDVEQSFEEDNRNPQKKTQNDNITQTKATLEHSEKNESVITALNSDILAVPAYQKTMEEIIAEDRLITENAFPENQAKAENQAEEHAINITIDSFTTSVEKSIEEVILEDQQIIESLNNNIKFPMIIGNTKEILSLQ